MNEKNKLNGAKNEPAPKIKKAKPPSKAKKKQPVKLAKPEPLYRTTSWKGVRDVYICSKCKHQADDKDWMFLHVVSHLPKAEQSDALNKLMKE